MQLKDLPDAAILESDSFFSFLFNPFSEPNIMFHLQAPRLKKAKTISGELMKVTGS